MPRIAVFCGASSGHAAHWKALAAEVGRTLALNKFGIVYGGGHVGLMGVVADAAMKAGGEVIGVIPRFMEKSELAHQGVTELILVDTMHQRKQRMHELSDVVIALPGGFGTMDELFELLTWRQIGLHRQPIGLLNAHGFYDPLLDQVRLMRREGFLHGETDLIV
ncbi:MAG TPA: TIGR00730 family Rossman fold protein, partial [Flavobacteriales bacterium]|nr:TIGR00730 family Rossman fold protein [Flavobacteriales bacterium]